MQGYPLTEYENITCSGTCDPTYTMSTLDNMVPFENVKWSPIVSIKEELVNHMKENITNDIQLEDEEEKYLEGTSNLLIKFMERFQQQQKRMNMAEIKMKRALEENKKDIDVLTTFVSFLQTVDNKCSQNTGKITTDIKEIAEDIQKNSQIKEVKETYILEKKKFHKYLNIIKLVNQMNVGSTCSICLGENVNSYFNPCGHTACSNCIKQERDFSCPLCRSHVHSVHKLYFT